MREKKLDSPIDLFFTYSLWFPFYLLSNAFCFLVLNLSLSFLVFYSLNIFESKNSF